MFGRISKAILQMKYHLRWLGNGDYALHGGGQNMQPKQVEVL
jgi:hypothetical protein